MADQAHIDFDDFGNQDKNSNVNGGQANGLATGNPVMENIIPYNMKVGDLTVAEFLVILEFGIARTLQQHAQLSLPATQQLTAQVIANATQGFGSPASPTPMEDDDSWPDPKIGKGLEEKLVRLRLWDEYRMNSVSPAHFLSRLIQLAQVPVDDPTISLAKMRVEHKDKLDAIVSLCRIHYKSRFCRYTGREGPPLWTTPKKVERAIGNWLSGIKYKLHHTKTIHVDKKEIGGETFLFLDHSRKRKEKDSSSYEPYPKRVKYTNEDGSVNLSASDQMAGDDDLSDDNGSEQEQDLSNVMLASDNHKD
jgi:hypothetical protein